MPTFTASATAEKVTTATGVGSGPTLELAEKAALKAANDALNLPEKKSRKLVNITTSIPGPIKSETKEFIYFDNCVSDIWEIGSDKRDLVCMEEGSWLLVVNYQLVGVGDGLAKMFCWLNVNGNDIQNTDCCGSCTTTGNDSILIVNSEVYLNVGDKIRCGVYSTDVKKILCKSSSNPPLGLECPPVIFNAVKTN